ncbi:MAG: tRNA pseudouridine(55) synthase TruB [Actinomycetota bacterium]|nr:tRNA pseudouridine(55) synthase TruB [Actinomycetota bacterium]MDQ2957480.1 tRNA pseudouridine(55) synthase TruB [Actinomycetota bacterium]
MAKKGPNGPGGLIVVDKPAGMTSHDVVGKVRRIAGTRRVGHAGTLDPMATGVLVLGVERATKLLNHLVLTDKTYSATIRLGVASSTDDAEGELRDGADASALTAADLAPLLASLTGEIMQRPSSVSAIKVDGQRAYARVRAGESVELAARPVTVSRFELLAEPRPVGSYLDCEVLVDCSSGTYIRALARDLGDVLGVGGHLTALRRSRVGPFELSQAITLQALAELDDPIVLPLPRAIAAAMPIRTLLPAEASELSFGRTIAPAGIEGTYGGIAESGEAVAILRESGGRARPVLGFTPAT